MYTCNEGKKMTEGVFVRKVSGVIRVATLWDGIFYGFLCATGLYFIGQQLVWGSYLFPGADPWIAICITGVFCLISLIVYGMLISAMPRSGGEYVFQSRTLKSGAIAFATVGSNLAVWNSFYSFIAGFTVLQGMISPLMVYLGVLFNNDILTQTGIILTDPWVLVILTIILIAISTYVLLKGLRPFLLFQKWFLMPAAAVGLIVILAVYLQKPPFVANFENFAARFAEPPANGWYKGVIDLAVEKGFNPHVGFSWFDTLGFASMVYVGFMYCLAPAIIAGEIKGADRLKSGISLTVGALLIQWFCNLVAFAGSIAIMGLPFLSSLGFLQYNYPELVPLPAYAYFSLPGYILISLCNLNPIISILIGLGFLACISQSLLNSPVNASRVWFAAAMDRILPDWFSKVNKHGAPLNLLFVQAFAVVLCFLMTLYPGLYGYWTGASLSGVIMFTFTLLGGLVFPFTARKVFEASPCSKYKLGKIPLISIFSIIGLVWAILMAYFQLAIEGFGLRGVPLYFVFGVYIVLLLYYYLAKWYRAKQGIDISLSFKEVPPA
jgi:amino acid transporter